MRAIEKPWVVGGTILLVVLLPAYMFYLGATSDPRFFDHALDAQEITWWELAMTACLLTAVFWTWLSSIRHAFNNNRYLLAGLILLVWPLSLIYGVWLAVTAKRMMP